MEYSIPEKRIKKNRKILRCILVPTPFHKVECDANGENKTSLCLRNAQFHELAFTIKQGRSCAFDPFGVTFGKSARPRSGVSEKKDKESQLDSFSLQGVTMGVAAPEVGDDALQIRWRHHICFPGPPFQQSKPFFQFCFDGLPKLSYQTQAGMNDLLTVVT